MAKTKNKRPDTSCLNTGRYAPGESPLPTPKSVWGLYERGQSFNTAINLEETVRVNENFFIGE